MPLAAIVLAVATPLAFSGGDLGDLGRRLADWSGLPTVALVQDPQRVRPFDIQMLEGAGDGRDLRRLLRVKAKVMATTDVGALAVSDGAWDDATVNRVVTGERSAYRPTLISPNPNWIKGGRVSVRLRPGEAVRVGDLAALPWSRPLAVHWFFQDLWIVPTSRAATEEAFLTAVAAAVSGRVGRSAKGASLDFDAPSFRVRAMETLARRTPGGDTPLLGKIHQEVVREAWSRASDATIASLYARPDQYAGWTQVSGGRMAVLASRYLAAQREFVAAPRPGFEQVASVIGPLIDDISFERPVDYGLNQSIGATFAWPRRSGGTLLL